MGPEKEMVEGANMVIETEDGDGKKSMRLEVAIVAVASIVSAIVCIWVIYAAM
jgi:hypothetical protein